MQFTWFPLALALALGLSARQTALGAETASSRNPCETWNLRPGCRIQTDGRCECGMGCVDEYPYVNKEECDNAVNVQQRNKCSSSPCRHGGSCIQITVKPGYKCRCEGTGFYGSRCQFACSRPDDQKAVRKVFPYECVVI